MEIYFSYDLDPSGPPINASTIRPDLESLRERNYTHQIKFLADFPDDVWEDLMAGRADVTDETGGVAGFLLPWYNQAEVIWDREQGWHRGWEPEVPEEEPYPEMPPVEEEPPFTP